MKIYWFFFSFFLEGTHKYDSLSCFIQATRHQRGGGGSSRACRPPSSGDAESLPAEIPNRYLSFTKKLRLNWVMPCQGAYSPPHSPPAPSPPPSPPHFSTLQDDLPVAQQTAAPAAGPQLPALSRQDAANYYRNQPGRPPTTLQSGGRLWPRRQARGPGRGWWEGARGQGAGGWSSGQTGHWAPISRALPEGERCSASDTVTQVSGGWPEHELLARVLRSEGGRGGRGGGGGGDGGEGRG